ncbi:hypothetical protein [Moraxella lacunata]|uniref:hypothetical protein n=1 Tax=Moraxella lacunata TaxID=477 RepID=UPI003EDF60C3
MAVICPKKPLPIPQKICYTRAILQFLKWVSKGKIEQNFFPFSNFILRISHEQTACSCCGNWCRRSDWL